MSAKAAALGPSYDVRRLSTVLEGELLAKWRALADEVKAQGW